MTEIEEDFLNIINDLKDKIDQPTKYNNKKSAGLIRQLLLDDYPLIDQVNSKHKLKMSFKVRKLKNAEPGIGKMIMEGIVPKEITNESDIETINRQKFLKLRCLILHEQIYNVQDIIKINSNVRGGIHSGKAKTEKEKLAVEMINTGPKIGYKNGEPADVTLGLVHPIAKILLKSLEELEYKIKNAL
ncbi:hypothetical protein Q4566_05290 [Tamlana sp. 2_MG-2023]|uniref:hypothetical protein n=1 Tax=unclassified Tamlana TaxID=2614803 RepID=UPI0026E40FC0|nr:MULTISPECIES: hypothetical protein [unclassified Tamlana]MDO6759608.1 hypothetical protein [Tamlana sp. 2_MG-2023]MDO6792165.1 hypothetical protein [Tamlana sp. 1_MG-2023]